MKELKEYLEKHGINLKDIPSRTSNDIYVIFEPTGVYSNYLMKFCTKNRIKTYIVNPKRASNFSKAMGNRSKTDKMDAKMLYAFNVLIDKDKIKVPYEDELISTLSVYVSSYWFLTKMMTSVSNRMETFEYARISGIASDVYAMLKEEKERYASMRRNIIDRAEELIKSDDTLKKKYENLLTIPGVGRVAAVMFVFLFSKFKDTNRREITALVGLDPIKKESGTSVRGTKRISKGGNRMIRKALYFPTMNAVQHNETIKSFYEKLAKEKHKPKKVALIASMRKLLLIAHSIYRNDTVFAPSVSISSISHIKRNGHNEKEETKKNKTEIQLNNEERKGRKKKKRIKNGKEKQGKRKKEKEKRKRE